MDSKAQMPAFPYAFHFPEQNGQPSGFSPGMTLRDYFAGHALAGTLANTEMVAAVSKASGSHLEAHRRVAVSCYEMADAMLDERAKP